MTHEQLRACLDTIGWSQRELAKRLGLDDAKVWRWSTGRYPVPAEIAAWLTKLAAAHQRYPAPEHA